MSPNVSMELDCTIVHNYMYNLYMLYKSKLLGKLALKTGFVVQGHISNWCLCNQNNACNNVLSHLSHANYSFHILFLFTNIFGQL